MKFHKLLFATMAMIAVAGCESNGDDGPDTTANDVYTISVDKTTIEADGKDAATFVVTNSAGENVLENTNLSKYVYFVNAADESRLKRGSVSFSSIRNGSYEFYATVKGKKTTNSVQITAQNRRKYEKYLHKVCIFQCTSVTCVYCPYMTSALGEVRKGDNKDYVIALACHGSMDSTNPYALVCQGGELGSIVCSRYGGEGYPYAVYDFAFGSHERSGSYINANVEEMLVRYPATCGVKISKAEIDAEGNATIEASVKADKAGTFDLAWAVLVDNLPKSGGYEEVYNDVVIAFSENFMGMSDQSKVTLAADEEYTKTYNFKIAPFRGVEFKVSDCKVVVFAHNAEMIDNANICAAGSSVDYVFNE